MSRELVDLLYLKSLHTPIAQREPAEPEPTLPPKVSPKEAPKLPPNPYPVDSW